MKKILLIIPAYNEEKSILKTIDSINKYKLKGSYILDYIIINDGSTDNTRSILNSNKLNYINLPVNLGIGGAVQTGYKYAFQNNYDIAVQFDADGQHDINSLLGIVTLLEAGESDLVIGSRFIKKTDNFISTFTRRLGIKIISFIIKFLTGKKVYDTTSGFRGANKIVIELFSKDYPIVYPEPISTANVLLNGLRVKEIHANMFKREAGKSSITYFKSIYYMIEVCLSLLILKIKKRGKNGK